MDDKDGVVDKKSIVKEILIDAAPEHVYAYLTQPSRIAEWIGTALHIDPRPGGIFRIVPNTRDVIAGEFREAVPFRKVAFTWGFEGEGNTVQPGSTLVEITLQPHGKGTLVRLEHRGLRGAARDKHAFGWDHYLSRIKIASEGGDPGKDPFSDPAVTHAM